MMTQEYAKITPERIEELRGNIVRATSWEQIFLVGSEELNVFGTLRQHLIDSYKLELDGSSLNPEGTIEIFTSTSDSSQMILLQRNTRTREVKLQRIVSGEYPPEPPQIFTYEVGNIEHNYTHQDTEEPDYKIMYGLEDFDKKNVEGLLGRSIYDFYNTVHAYYASQQGEEALLNLGMFPQRIGYHVWNDQYLQNVRQLREHYPQFFTQE